METGTSSIRTQIVFVNLFVVAVTVLLAMGATLTLTIVQDRGIIDRNLINSAQVVARVPMVIDALQSGAPNPTFTAYLDGTVSGVSDIDVIIVADTDSIQLYAPNQDQVGKPYSGQAQNALLLLAETFTSDDTGGSGTERCAYAPVVGADGALLGFVMVGMNTRSISPQLWRTAIYFALIALAAFLLGSLIATRASKRIKRPLMGYEPTAFLGLFHQREDILEALEEGVMAIDADAKIMYINRAASNMLHIERNAVGKPLREAFPRSTLGRILRTKLPEYNNSLLSIQNMHILSDHVPIWGDGRVIGAVAIFRNRTEVTRLAEDLTGVRHMVEAMRAYTHEFMNKFHVVLGLLQLGEPDRAEQYIMDVTSIHQRSVSAISDSIKNPSVAALLVGKTSRCAELGIQLILRPGSHLSADESILPADAYVTILGNLIENSVDAMNHPSNGLKQIFVSLMEDQNTLLICVEDTGPGMPPEMAKDIFKKGFTTKGPGHGTGLANVREVADAYQAEIRVESEPGIGTSFFLMFEHDAGRENTNV
ncbi:MAG: sensor histidine kinase [Lawsonibacter sp.]|nr:sensor histidine kinase [Lawsonibacter sp.]